MDIINDLPDDLLVKILSFVPTKIAIATSILSMRWRFLWMWFPKLEYDYHPNYRIEEFINRNLPLHRAQVIESLCLKSCGEREDINRWIEIAVSRHVRELEISCYSHDDVIFPSSFYTCKSLVILKLIDITLMEVPSLGFFPSLKTLELERVSYIDEAFLQSLLSLCPVLEELSLIFNGDENITDFSIVVPSLQSLSLCLDGGWNFQGYEIDTPNLKYLKLEDFNFMKHYYVFKNMPKLKEAHINAEFLDLKKLIGSIIFVKRLTICATEGGYGGGFVFNQLEYLKLCPCNQSSLSLLGRFLEDSPSLRVLDLSYREYHHDDDQLTHPRFRWNQPSPVPECLLSSLQIFKWSEYFGRPKERDIRDIVVYILKNAHCLKKAIILADTERHLVPNLKMIKELTLSSRASRMCELVFVEDDRSI